MDVYFEKLVSLMLVLSMLLTSIAGDTCYEIVNDQQLDDCYGVDCSRLFCGSRSQWLWSCYGANRHWMCSPYGKRDNSSNDLDILSVLSGNGWTVLEVESDSIPTNSTVLSSVNELIEVLDELDVLPECLTGLISGLIEERNDRVKTCQRLCVAFDNFQHYCQLNAVNIGYNVIKASCLYACNKKYGKGKPC